MANKIKIELRPKAEEISTESLMMFFAECLKEYCSEKRGCVACSNCPFYKEKYGCRIADVNPENWRVGK